MASPNEETTQSFKLASHDHEISPSFNMASPNEETTQSFKLESHDHEISPSFNMASPNEETTQSFKLASHDHEISLSFEMASSREDPREKLSLTEHMFSWRGVIYFLLHFTFIAWCIPRSATSMAFVCINSRREEVLQNFNVSGDESEAGDVISGVNTSDPHIAEHRHILEDISWDSRTKGLVLSGPLMLSFLGPVISDVIMRRTGCRYLFSCGQLVNALIMFASPSLARASPYALLASHILMGLTINLNFPIIATLLPRWTPLKQKLTVVSLVFIGPTLGAMVTSLLNGYLCAIPVDNGWPFLFYVAGAMHVLFALAWFTFIGDYPETHRFISEKEKNYIVARRPELQNTTKASSDRPPYKAILTSIPVLSFIFVFDLFVWTIQVTMVYIPIYLNDVHRFTPSQTGIAFALICGIRILGAFFWSFVGNQLTNRKVLSTAVTRKACICIGISVASVLAVVVSFLDRDQKWVAVSVIMMCLFCHAVTTSHLNCVPMDMAPRYAGTITSLAVSPSLMLAISGPLLVGAITPSGSYEEWSHVWYLLAGIFFTIGFVFLVFSQAKPQKWALNEAKDVPKTDQLLKS